MPRPRLNIELDSQDRIIEAIGAVAIILLIALPAYYYGQLPESIPGHYDWRGQPDSYSNKATIWILPAIGIFLFVVLTAVNKYPHTFNYLTEITEENAPEQYRIVGKLMRGLNTLITCLFTYMTYSTILTALGKQNGLGPYFLPIFLALIFGATGYYLYRSIKLK